MKHPPSSRSASDLPLLEKDGNCRPRTVVGDLDVSSLHVEPLIVDSDGDDTNCDEVASSSTSTKTSKRGQAQRRRYPLSSRRTCLDHMDNLNASG